jgi:hypothetical protein
MVVRWLLVLMLIFAVGSGFVGNGIDGPCAPDDCGQAASDADHGAADGGADDCPPFCAGCVRLAAHVAPVIALGAVPQDARAVTSVPPIGPPAAPPSNGLFRPPRA